jgi:hypothetical protein
MIAEFLLSEAIITKDGTGSIVPLGDARGKTLRLTLGITSIVEQESLDLAIFGSSDGQSFDSKPLGTFPQKFYCGTYVMVLDLEGRPEITHIRAQWKMNRWGRGSQTPMFGFYVFAQPVPAQAIAAVV